MGTARNGEIEIAYETFGSGDDPALVLLHGLGSSMLVWPEEMCAGFVDRGFFVLRMDYRGSELSTVLADGARYTLDDCRSGRSGLRSAGRRPRSPANDAFGPPGAACAAGPDLITVSSSELPMRDRYLHSSDQPLPEVQPRSAAAAAVRAAT